MKNFKLLGNLIFLMGPVFLITLLVWDHKFKASSPAEAKITTRHFKKSEILRQLKLTENQKDRIRQIRRVYRKEKAETDAQFMLEMVDLENEIEKPNPNMSRLDYLCKKIGRLKGLKLKEQISTDLELKNEILTPQQADQLMNFQESVQVWGMEKNPGNPG